MAEIQQVLTFIISSGPLGLAAIIIYSNYKRIWVWGSAYDKLAEENKKLLEANAQLKAEKDEYKFLAWAGTSMAEKITKLKKVPD